ncbi:MAG: glycoside hydrolase family 32 protein [Planctomycetales bacterium]|nr:glycoside hydrolase family 32 protein [Planctomycetales bacterium]
MICRVPQVFLGPRGYAAIALLLLPCAALQGGEPLFPNADFETGALDGWKQIGDAFQFQPTKGDNSRARGRESSGHDGEYWIGGFEKYGGRGGRPGDVFTDDATGRLVSPEFTIKKRYITFLVGGGNRPGETGVRLVCDGAERTLATGADSETLLPCSCDVSEFQGKRARLVVFDEARGSWGHVNVDSFCAADEPLPDSMGAFALAEGIPTEAGPNCSYNQPLRPQFHFTACQGWLNDPNGMVYDGEKYHLFFQHNPLAPVWGNMTWGHATSPDMIHWTQQAHALLPYRVDRRAGTIFSGTAVVDFNNSLGVQRGDQKTLCAFFTFAAAPKFYQAMAYSTDGGATWTYWNEGRAVVENQGFDDGERDPKVFWHEPSRRWVIALWVQQHPGRVRFFTSEDLVHWQHASDLMRDWAFECMDVVFLPVDGQGPAKAVIYDASFDYEVGTFDGREFHAQHGPYRAGGGNFYAAQTFNQNRDGRAVQISWMRGGPNAAELYGVPFNQQMSFPCELTLRTVGDEVRLCAWPIAEIESLVEESIVREDETLSDGDNLLAGMEPLDLVDLNVSFDPGAAKRVVFEFSGALLTYDADSRRLVQRSVDEQGGPVEVVVFEDLRPRDGLIELRLLVDRLSVETFAFGGERFFAAYYSPQRGDGSQTIHAEGGEARVKRLEISRLRSAWAGRNAASSAPSGAHDGPR